MARHQERRAGTSASCRSAGRTIRSCRFSAGSCGTRRRSERQRVLCECGFRWRGRESAYTPTAATVLLGVARYRYQVLSGQS